MRLPEPTRDKAERIVAFLISRKVTAAEVRSMLNAENASGDTPDSFWQTCATKAGVNFPSRKARELVAEIMDGTRA